MSRGGMPVEEVEQRYERLRKEAEASGYRLNPDAEFVKDLVRGLLTNEARYGYRACPCRLASGIEKIDLDIVCPCDYRDPDLSEFGACYCALYVSDEVAAGTRRLTPVPERRTEEQARRTSPAPARDEAHASLSHPVWRCRVCGYLCAREEPPELCPICKARKERFERFL